ncbi:hypothetical protein J4731_17180 [Providencia rettgeri]|nr:hypothetical protein [Providencia rettgeri]
MAKEYMDDMSESIQTLKSELDYVNALKSKLTDMAENAAMKALGKGAKAVAKLWVVLFQRGKCGNGHLDIGRPCLFWL